MHTRRVPSLVWELLQARQTGPVLSPGYKRAPGRAHIGKWIRSDPPCSEKKPLPLMTRITSVVRREGTGHTTRNAEKVENHEDRKKRENFIDTVDKNVGSELRHDDDEKRNGYIDL